jgi:hypothetical protein
MPSIHPYLVFALLLALSQSLTAQYRSTKRTADKEFELHAYNLAIRSYQRVLTYREDDQDALARLGHAYRMINELDSAKTYYARAADGRQVSAGTLLGYAHTLKMLGEYDEAERLYLAYAREENQTVGNHYANSVDFARRQARESAGYTVQRLEVNTAAPEFGPTLPRPDQLVFNSARTGTSFDGVATTRPYVAEIIRAGLVRDPVPVDYGNVGASGKVGPVSYSPDGTQVIFTRNTFTPGTRLIPEAGPVLNLFIAEVNPAGQWVNARPLPFNETISSAGYGSFAPDGESIYFASDRAGGFGGYDIYRAHRLGDGWEAYPENLGATLNSQGDEITPFYDGESIFFASDWHQGLGGFDVFRAELERRRPTQLYHMGGAVNSGRDDLGLIYDPLTRTGYFVSNRDGNDTREDLYFLSPEPSPPVAAADSLSLTGEGRPGGPKPGSPEGVNSDDAPIPYGAVRGFVSDLQTGAPIADAGVLIVERQSGRAATTRTDVNGAYFATVGENATYDISVDAAGYESMEFPVTTGTSFDPELLGNIMLLPAQATPAPARMRPDSTAGSPPPAAPAPGFAIQLASVRDRPDLSQFAAVSDYGRVYTVEENGRYKVRLGDFTDRAVALEATRQLREAGYAEAFVVAGSAPEAGAPPTAPAPAPYENEPAAPGSYRVQLGAFGQPQNFDRQRAAELGTLREETRSGLTVFLIDDIPDAAAARRIQSRARELGYTGAYALEPTPDGYRKLQ